MKKSFLLTFSLIYMFTAWANLAFAQNSGYDYTKAGVGEQIKQYLCAPTQQTPTNSASSTASSFNNNAASSDLYNCINRLYKFAIVLASVIGVFFIVISGYLYMSAEGSQEAVDKAKSILVSTITSLVILFGGYVLLKALNPDLVQFRSIQPPSVVVPTTTPPSITPTPAGGGGIPSSLSSDVQTAAKTIQTLASQGKLSVNSTACDCANNCPDNTLKLLANGQQAQKDGPTTCNTGTTTVNKTMLDAIIATANDGFSFQISSLTGGHHSNANDVHYQGRAVDAVPMPSSNQQSIIQDFQKNGATTVAIECKLNGTGVYWPVPGSAQANDTRCMGQQGYHIHAQW